MDGWGTTIAKTAQALVETACEAVWPTRCAVCDEFGQVLCGRCARTLPFVDQWRACPRCGAPYGLVQCCDCSELALAQLGREKLPFAACASAVMFDRRSGKLVHVFKDLGEQRLAHLMANMMLHAMPYDWTFDAVTYVPASLASYRRRGFEQAGFIARELAVYAEAPLKELLRRPHTRDQRALSRAERIANLKGRFKARHDIAGIGDVLLVDDVYTTGSTLCDASDALLAAGAHSVKCLTFARA